MLGDFPDTLEGAVIDNYNIHKFLSNLILSDKEKSKNSYMDTHLNFFYVRI